MHVLAVVLLSQAVGLTLAWAALPLLAGDGLSSGQFLLAVAAGSAGALGLIAFYQGMAIGSISVVTPIAALGVAVPVSVGLAQGESPRPIQLAGIAVAVVAVAMASYEPDPEHRPVTVRPVLLALVAALGFGTFLAGVDATASDDSAWTIAAIRIGGVSTALAGVLAARPSLEVPSGSLPWIAVIGLGDVLANTLYAVATTKGLLALVAVGGSLYPAVTVGLAHLVLGERLTRLQKAGVTAALAAVVMIAAGS